MSHPGHAVTPFGIGLTRALDRIGGNRSGRLPQLLETIQPVAVYSDLSRSIASEALERRASVSWTQTEQQSQYGGVELHAHAPGGLIVERITARCVFDDSGVAFAVQAFSQFTPGPGTLVPHVDVGGRPVRSELRYEPIIAALPSPHVILKLNVNIWEDVPLERIYVPAGWYFVLMGANTTAKIYGSLTWRELDDVQTPA